MTLMMQRFTCQSIPWLCSRPAFKHWLGVSSYHSGDGVYGHKPEKQPVTSQLDPLVVDPLKMQETISPVELEPSHYGLSEGDTGTQYDLKGIINIGREKGTLAEIQEALRAMYTESLTAEFQHLNTLEEREWFANRYEELSNMEVSSQLKVTMAKLMLQSQAFDHFLASKFTTVKRYGGEGAESAMIFYDELFRIAANTEVDDLIVCIAHRGRLNLLTNLMKFPPVDMFVKMKGRREFPEDVSGTGDVLSHLTSSVDLEYDGGKVHATMLPNPSHLEAVNPVAVGKTRARMQSRRLGEYSLKEEVSDEEKRRILCLQVHGDAAFAGQGVVAETFMLADAPHFTVGGSIHLIVNNQIGFTTDAERGRSSTYSSCVGKLIASPIIRVNGDYPEDVMKACQLAVEYRQKFGKDVIVDYVCYRRWGHNELDEPAFTQPAMYRVIRDRQSIPDIYAKKLADEGVIEEKDLQSFVSQWNAYLSEQMAKADNHVPEAKHLEQQWSGLVQAPNQITHWDTGVPTDLLKFVGSKSVAVPESWNVHPTLKKTHIDRRLQKMQDGTGLDWATAEALAMGSLLRQGFNIRICGQDVGRGTFSHRHAMLVDQTNDAIYIPLNHMDDQQTDFLEVANSILSEEAVLGFEYGFSIESPKTLVIWEAQFGDFFNGAQIMVDTFITGGETKWLLQSGLVMLLPHGLDGAGPEHSSCRLERFLQMCDSKEDGIDGEDINFQLVNPTTPAQYFHLLRRQMVRSYRKPLVLAAPKVILRHPTATSDLSDMAPGTYFQPVLSDPVAHPGSVRRVVFVCGKHAYPLEKERQSRGVDDMAIIRVESLCPFPSEELRKEIRKYPNAQDFVWSQEEHRNHGAWSFVAPRFEQVVGCKLRYVGREVHPTPATGVVEIHKQQAEQIVQATFS